jgi:two-component system KDP operon response regulator KdpE
MVPSMSIDSRPQVLIADDEPAMARLVARTLGEIGFKVSTVLDGAQAVERVWESNPDVLLLDLGMPGMSGHEVLRELHGRHPVRIIVVSGQDSPAAISEALDLGADDYVTKPFAVSELAARIRAVLRRERDMLHGRRRLGRAEVDFDAGTITVDGEPADISRRAWRLLEHLVKLDGAVATHDELLEQTFGPAYVGDAAYLRLWIGQLRRALGAPIWDEGVIRTVPGIGYALDTTGRRPARRPRQPRRPRATATPAGRLES